MRLFRGSALACSLLLALAPGCGEAPSELLDSAADLDAALAIDARRLDAFVADDVPRPADDAGPTDAPASSEDATMEADTAAGADAAVAADAGPPSPEGCLSSVAAGHHVFTCDSIAFDVEISGTCALGGCGLILDVHGATMNATSEDLNTNLRALGAARGYVVVQPTAPASAFGPSWDPVRDDPRVFSFLTLAMRALRIDPARVHITGFSQGGFMSWRMLCDHADVFASVAPAAACGALFRACSFTPSARPSEEIPVLYMHGRSDPIVGGCYATQRAAVVGGWSMTLDSTVSMNAAHTWSRYVSASGNVFESIDHDYRAYSTILGGHCVPGSPDIGTSRFGTTGYGCEEPVAFDWGEAVIAFFEAHPRR